MWLVIANEKNVGSPLIKLIYFPEVRTNYILCVASTAGLILKAQLSDTNKICWLLLF